MIAPPLTPEATAVANAADTVAILAALRAAGGNLSEAAETLKLNRRTLARRIAALGLRADLKAAYPVARRRRKT